MLANTTVIGNRYNGGTMVVTSLEHVGRTVAHYRYTECVSSDHAMIDSGSRLCVIVADANNMPRAETYYTDDNGYHVETDAPDYLVDHCRNVCRVVRIMRRRIEGMRAEQTENEKVKRGDTVEVFKGRKVAKGRYQVVAMAMGQYGPYFNLRDAAGRFYSYVSQDNCRKVDIPPLSSTGYSADEWAFMLAILARPNDSATIGAFADWMQERGEPDGEYLSAWVSAGMPELPYWPK